MMIPLFIQIIMDNPHLDAYDFAAEIDRATRCCVLPNISKYGVVIDPVISYEGRLVFEIRIPAETAESYSIYSLVRTIAYNLRKNNPKKYNSRIFGEKILDYSLVANPRAFC